MSKKQHDTPMLDQLESGPWPSFVTGLKRLAKDSDYMTDLMGQLEHSYKTRKGYDHSFSNPLSAPSLIYQNQNFPYSNNENCSCLQSHVDYAKWVYDRPILIQKSHIFVSNFQFQRNLIFNPIEGQPILKLRS